MRSIADFIEALGGATSVASALNLPVTTVASWKGRGSIPSAHWVRLVEAAHQRGIDDFTFEALAESHAPERVEAHQ